LKFPVPVKRKMAWIKTISYEEATGRLKGIYDRVKGPNNVIDNILKVHSLRPHTLEGHMALYKYVLHHPGNRVDKWLLEAIGVYVSMLNSCSYCVDHHFEGLKRLLDDDNTAGRIRLALEKRSPEDAFNGKQSRLLRYAEKLTMQPADICKKDISLLNEAGYDDGQILEVNQVTAYFNYANRTVLGLGVNTEGDMLGLSPHNSENTDDWTHG